MRGGNYILMGVLGTELDVATAAIIREVQPAGFILFGRNIKTAPQLRKLIDDLCCEVKHRPVMTIDQEGGRVSRLKECGTEPPSAKQLREKSDPELIERHGRLTGEILRLFGFNLDLCPVLDVSYAGDIDNSLKNRTWGLTPVEVVYNAGIFTRSMRGQGILSCGKHFPGYSRAAVDPHHELPVVARSRADLEGDEWIAFRALLDQMDSMMVGHANYPALDGTVISDDLDMGAIVGHYGLADSVTRAVEAGNDLVLLCHRPELIPEATKALETISPARAAEAEKQIASFLAQLQPAHDFSVAAHAAIDARIMQLRIDTLGAEQAAQRSADDGKRSPVETF